jgi:hypothetical protein
LLIALFGSFRRTLERPTHLAEDFPDVTLVIMDAGNSLDYRRHALESPKIGAVAVRSGSLSQLSVEPLQLLKRESRTTAQPTRSL